MRTWIPSVRFETSSKYFRMSLRYFELSSGRSFMMGFNWDMAVGASFKGICIS